MYIKNNYGISTKGCLTPNDVLKDGFNALPSLAERTPLYIALHNLY